MSLPQKLAFVDLETTGGSPSFDRVIEVGIVRVEEGVITQTFQSLVNPAGPVPEEILQLTGINRAQLEKAPSFWEVAKEIVQILAGCYFVAHNVRFDYSFLRQELKRLEYSFSPKQICTVKLSRLLYPQYRHHNLDSLIERYGFKFENRHRAFDDAAVLWQFYQKITAEFEEEKLEEILKKLFKKPSVPIKIPEEVLESLPESPGVYIFYGANRCVLYIGKSINIKKRVLQHFASDYLSSKELKIASLIEDIEFIQTSGEFGALIKESSLIKQRQPIYNRALRYQRELLLIKRYHDEKGYWRVGLETAKVINLEDLDSIITIAKSKKSAGQFLLGVCQEYELCEVLLGLEKSKGACFGQRLGRCQGGCLGKESNLSYNQRFVSAFQKHQIKPWPFQNPILIREASEEDRGDGFLIDKWCYLGKVTSDGQSQEWNIEQDIKFDFDTYKILSRFINQRKAKFVQIKDPNFYLRGT